MSFTRRLLFCIVSAAWLVFGLTGEAFAQPDHRQFLQMLITELQTGTPTPALIGPQLWQTVAMQTGNTGIYAPLAQLGAVTSIDVYGQQQFPAGMLYQMSARHQYGESNWTIVISYLSGKTEYATFVPTLCDQTTPA